MLMFEPSLIGKESFLLASRRKVGCYSEIRIDSDWRLECAGFEFREEFGSCNCFTFMPGHIRTRYCYKVSHIFSDSSYLTSRLQSVMKITYFGRDVRDYGLATHENELLSPGLPALVQILLQCSNNLLKFERGFALHSTVFHENFLITLLKAHTL